MDPTAKLLVFFAVWWVVWVLHGLYVVYRAWACDLREEHVKDKYEQGL